MADGPNIFDEIAGGDIRPREATPVQPLPPPPQDPSADQTGQSTTSGQGIFDKIAGGELLPRGSRPPGETSAFGSLGRAAERAILPMAGGLAAAGTGARIGGALGSLVGPEGALAGGLGGALVGGVAGMFLGGAATQTVQNYALSKAPDSWKEAIGQDDRQQQLDEKEHPYASFLGGIAPYALTMRPGGFAMAKLPENATAFQRLMANPVTARVFGGAAMGGMELGQEYLAGEDLDWRKGAIATGFGLIFNKPTRLGEVLTGDRNIRDLFARRQVATPPAGAAAEPPPTVAEAGDAKVMGPGITEPVFRGAHVQAPDAEMAAQEARRTEVSATQPAPPPDLNIVARQMHPELFDEYEALQARRDALAASPVPVPQEAAQVNAHIDALSPEIAAAYRRAAEAVGAPTVEPATSVQQTPEQIAVTEQQRTNIAKDVERQLTEAGRPMAEAQAYGALMADYYVRWSQRMGGALGTPEEVYGQYGPRIQGPRSASAVVEAPGRVQSAIAGTELFQRELHDKATSPSATREDQDRYLSALSENGARKHERIVAASITVDGKIYTALSHGEALEKAAEELNEPFDAIADRATGMDGFVTSEGRNISRTQAVEIAMNSGQTKERLTEYRFGRPLDELDTAEIGYRGLQNKTPYLATAMTKEDTEKYHPELSGRLSFPFYSLSRDNSLAGFANQEEAVAYAHDKSKEFWAHYAHPIRDFEQAEKEDLFQSEGDRQAPAFYSAVERAITSAKQAKASPEQWLATLKNLPGVKPEEMEWLGLPDWLREQKDTVTREQVADYVRANNLQLQEVTKGGDQSPYRIALQEVKKAYDSFHATIHGSPESDAALDRFNAATEHAESLKEQEKSEQPRYENYTLPGAEPGSYREMLLMLPAKEAQAAVDINNKLMDKYGSLSDAFANWTPSEQAEFDRVHGSASSAAEPYRSSHWDEPNVLAHIRLNDRVIDGKKTLFVEEVQSDAHQEGRKKGYKKDIPVEQINAARDAATEARKALGTVMFDLEKKSGDTLSAAEFNRIVHGIESANDLSVIDGIVSRHKALDVPEFHQAALAYNDAYHKHMNLAAETRGVPNLPFKTTWPELSLKRILRHAAENGYEKVAWAPGAVHAERYDLSKRIGELAYWKDGNYFGYSATTPEGSVAFDQKYVAEDKLEDTFGKDVADRMRNMEGEDKSSTGFDDTDGVKYLSGEGLRVGGSGMAGFYDKILPAAANKLVKKFGAKVGQDVLPPAHVGAEGNVTGWESTEPREGTMTDAQPVHSIDITDSLRNAAMEQGFSLFQRARGKVRFVEGERPTMTLGKLADASTFGHEQFGHIYLEDMLRFAEHPMAPEDLKADAQETLNWLGIKDRSELMARTPSGSIPAKVRRAHEKFAEGAERYFTEGVAPSQALARVFEQLRKWIVNVYDRMKAQGIETSFPELTEGMRRVYANAFDRDRVVLAGDRERQPSLADIHEADAEHTTPEEAGPAADRIAAETDRAVADIPPEILHEISTAEAAIAPAQAGGPGEPGHAAGAEPGGKVGPGAAEGGALGRLDTGAEPEPGGEDGGGEPGTVGAGGAKPAPEGHSGEPGKPGGPGSAQGARNANPLSPSASDLFGPRESPFLDRAGNIRVDNLTSREDVAQAIRDAAAANNDFIGDRRGKISDQQVRDLADALGMTFESLDKRKLGEAFNAEQILAARKLLIQSATDTAASMQKAAFGTDEDVANYARTRERQWMIQAQIAGMTAEWGRAGRALRDISSEWTPEGKAADEFLRNITGATGRTLWQLRVEARMGAKLDTAAKIAQFIRDAQTQRSFGRWVVEYWTNALISGLATHVTYFMAGQLLSLQRAVPETAMAAAIGKAREAMGRPGERVRGGEVAANLRALFGTIPAATQAAVEGFRTSMTTLLPGETQHPSLPIQGDISLNLSRNMTNDPVHWSEVQADVFSLVRGWRDGIVSTSELVKAGGHQGAPVLGFNYTPGQQIGDLAYRGVTVLPIGGLARFPGRVIAALHSFQRMSGYSIGIAGEAYRIADTEGLTGNDKAARIGALRQQPSPEMMERSGAGATQAALMGQVGPFTQTISRLTNMNIIGSLKIPGTNIDLGGWPLLKFIDPFVRIASNVMDQSIMQRSPVGVLSPEIRADLLGKNGNIAQDMAMSRMICGTALAVTVGGLAAEGFVSGSGPSDSKEAAIWRLAGNQAHSVRIGDMWYQTNRLGPMGMLMGISADLYDVAHAASKGDLTQAAAMLHHAFVQNILDESFMRGPADLIRAVEDPGRYGEGYIRSFASSFVPYSVGLAQIDRASDPYSREARTVMDAIKAKIPGLSEELLPRRDIWGEPMPNREALAPGVTAIYETQVSRDPVNQAMLALGVYPAQVERRIRNVQLTDQEYDDYARVAGRSAKMRLNAIVQSPDFQRFPNDVKHTVMANAIEQARESARNYIMMQYPQIPRDATLAKRSRHVQ